MRYQTKVFIATSTMIYALDYYTTTYALSKKIGNEANPLHAVTAEGVVPWIWVLTYPLQVFLFAISASKIERWARRNRGKVFGSDIWSLIFRNRIRNEIQGELPRIWIMFHAGLVGVLLLHATVAVNNACVISLFASCLFFQTDFGFQFSYMIGMIPAWLASTVLALLVTAVSIQRMLEAQGR